MQNVTNLYVYQAYEKIIIKKKNKPVMEKNLKTTAYTCTYIYICRSEKK